VQELKIASKSRRHLQRCPLTSSTSISANEGASRVVGVDISGPFIEALKSQPTPAGTTWIQADIEHLGDVGELAGQTFDIITVLCSAMGSDRTRTLRAIAELLTPDPSALVVLYMAHPLRFSLQRSLKEARPLGQTYFDRTPFSYRSNWNPQITLTDHPKTFSDVINAITSAGFFIELSREPELAVALATEFPHKRAWLDENVGGWGVRLRRLPNVPAAPEPAS
jgi:hypothetical protein